MQTNIVDAADLEARITRLEGQLTRAENRAARAMARGEVENLFSRYMYLHNAYQDEEIVNLWVKNGTPGIQAQYSNAGVYTTWESVTSYHRGRPAPVGKLLLHYTTTPVIEVAEDGETARGVWIMAGLESGLTNPEVAAGMPAFMYSPGEVQGKKVWAHWVWCKYALDFLKQDGEWKIWHFRCFEVARAPFEENWISFAEKNAVAFDLDLMYFGDDGKPVFMPPPDEPATSRYSPYRPDQAQTLDPRPPTPYTTFDETSEYQDVDGPDAEDQVVSTGASPNRR